MFTDSLLDASSLSEYFLAIASTSSNPSRNAYRCDENQRIKMVIKFQTRNQRGSLIILISNEIDACSFSRIVEVINGSI